MIRILDQWTGKFEVNGEIYNDLYDFEYKNGEEFHIKLLAKRREVKDGKKKEASV
jgi:hypothetical protein